MFAAAGMNRFIVYWKKKETVAILQCGMIAALVSVIANMPILPASMHRAVSYYNIGMAFSNNGEFETAVEYYRKAVRLNPVFSAAHYNMAMDLEELGRVEEAMGQYLEVLRINPKSYDSLVNLGALLVSIGKVDLAGQYYEKAMEVDSEPAIAYYNMGVLYEKKKSYEKAKRFYREALQRNPDHDQARIRLEKVNCF